MNYIHRFYEFIVYGYVLKYMKFLGPPIILHRPWPCCSPCIQAFGCIGGEFANAQLAAQLSFGNLTFFEYMSIFLLTLIFNFKGANFGGPQLIFLNGLESLNGLCGRCC